MSNVKPVVVHEGDVALEGWSDRTDGLQWKTLISGDRTASDSITVGVVDVHPRDVPRWHRHAHAEVYYVLQGQGVVKIDGVEHAIEAGSTVFIPGNAEHGARNTGSDVMRIFYVFAADSFSDVEYVFSG